MDSPVCRPFIFVRTLDCTFVNFLVLKSIYDIVSVTKRFVLLCPVRDMHMRVANTCVLTGTLNFETLKMDFNQNVWL